MRAFILASTQPRPAAHAPEILLHVATELCPLWRATEETLEAAGLPPPFWAFAWAGGQALARYVLDHPQTVADKRVLDFAAGSGLAAIAAAMAGAREVEASEIDPFAPHAMRLNAALNDVSIQPVPRDVTQEAGGWDVILAGDVCYDRKESEATLTWLRVRAGEGADVLIGDPGRAYLPETGLTRLAEYTIETTLELEDASLKRTGVWRLEP